MREPQAIACTLDEPEWAARRRAIREQLLVKAASVHELPDGYRLRFEASADVRDTIDEFIALERRCCSFLRFDVSDAVRGSDLTLTLTGPEGAKGVIGEVLADPSAVAGQAAPVRRGVDNR